MGLRPHFAPGSGCQPSYGNIGAARLKTSVRMACSAVCVSPRATHFAISTDALTFSPAIPRIRPCLNPTWGLPLPTAQDG